jgi:hypothetical protein
LDDVTGDGPVLTVSNIKIKFYAKGVEFLKNRFWARTRPRISDSIFGSGWSGLGEKVRTPWVKTGQPGHHSSFRT